MADITINLLKSKSAVLQYNGITIISDNNYKVIAGEQKATTFKLVYDKTKYADYSLSIDMVNAAGYGKTLTQADIVNDKFTLPVGMAVAGYMKMSVSATKNDDSEIIVKWELIKIKVWETTPDWKQDVDKRGRYVTNAQFDMLVNKVNKIPDALYFETEADFQEYLSTGFAPNQPDLDTVAGGTTFYIIETGVPDYWWDDKNHVAYELEVVNETLELGEVETLEPDEEAYAEDVTGAPHHVWKLGIPRGEKGEKGEKGENGGLNAATMAELKAYIDNALKTGITDILNTPV